jgi:lipid II:glycine glycyltransferase (peptidoglycan interpeptide bridge formation enzyme)
MAPYLLQWQAIKDAKAAGCEAYDFGGIRTEGRERIYAFPTRNSWAGITKFKTGFSPATKPIEFPGSYDIIINPVEYWMYRGIQKMKSFIK